MPGQVISYHEDFVDLCEHIRESGLVAFDTEFVSESTYRPELGLLQFATEERCAAVDPLSVGDLARWWEIMADDTTTVVVHGGQAEIRFCLQQIGRAPKHLYDIQIAEGFRGRSYPLSYSAIVHRVLGIQVDGSQTRTDWLRRPLSAEQIRYALEDVQHVLEIWHRQRTWLSERGRLEWAEGETRSLIDGIVADELQPPWTRLSGIHKLNRRELLIVQKLAAWREEEAAFRNRPARRILRDDLLIDLAKRKPTTRQKALATRDLNRPEYKRRLDDMVAVIQEAVSVPDSELPDRQRCRRQEPSSDEQVISKLLSLALSNRCAELEISQSLVAANRELADLVRHHRFGVKGDRLPKLLEGWRAEVCGKLLQDVLDGRVGFRVAEKDSDTPLVFEYGENSPESGGGKS
ncbi:MAG: HRDC domain-containing protein [Planctomycetaceae bacterium]|nr:HRDC domain-containing protein [Planctomycetaceae bacterium]